MIHLVKCRKLNFNWVFTQLIQQQQQSTTNNKYPIIGLSNTLDFLFTWNYICLMFCVWRVTRRKLNHTTIQILNHRHSLCTIDAARTFLNISKDLAATTIRILFILSHFFVKTSFESVAEPTLRFAQRKTMPNFGAIVYLKINNL